MVCRVLEFGVDIYGIGGPCQNWQSIGIDEPVLGAAELFGWNGSFLVDLLELLELILDQPVSCCCLF